jgi:hypothetical protein
MQVQELNTAVGEYFCPLITSIIIDFDGIQQRLERAPRMNALSLRAHDFAQYRKFPQIAWHFDAPEFSVGWQERTQWRPRADRFSHLRY